MSIHGHPRSYKVNCHVHNSNVIHPYSSPTAPCFQIFTSSFVLDLYHNWFLMNQKKFSSRPQVSSMVIMVVFLSLTFSFVFLHPTLSWNNRSLSFLFFRWHPLKYRNRMKYNTGWWNTGSCVSWRSALELDGKRKEYSARGRYQSEYKKRDVAGKFNILGRIAPAV